jgi:hypothetical protein
MLFGNGRRPEENDARCEYEYDQQRDWKHGIYGASHDDGEMDEETLAIQGSAEKARILRANPVPSDEPYVKPCDRPNFHH